MKIVLNDILNLIFEHHCSPFFYIDKEQIYKYADELIDLYGIDNVHQLIYVANCLIKKIFGPYDQHTQVYFGEGWNHEISIPVGLSYFGDDIYIFNIKAGYEQFLYGKILKVNDVDLNVLFQEIDNMITYSTDVLRNRRILECLKSNPGIRRLPSIDSDAIDITYTVLCTDGVIRKLSFNYDDTFNPPAIKYGFKTGTNLYYEILEGNVLRIVYSQCKEDFPNQMKDFSERINNLITENDINKVIIDLRGNGGGNSHVIEPLLEILNEKQIVVLVSDETYSSGNCAVYDLKRLGGIIVGNPLTECLCSFGDVSLEDDTTKFAYYLDYGNFSLKVSISRKFFYFDSEYRMHSILKKDFENEFDYKMINCQNLEPDFYKTLSLEDYKNKFDSQKDFALNLLNNKKIK